MMQDGLPVSMMVMFVGVILGAMMVVAVITAVVFFAAG
jgi:hypothetical protein